MCARHFEFSGPTLRPLGKWFVAVAILTIYTFPLALGVSHGLPGWLQDLGWALSLLFLFGSSVCLLWLYFKHGGKWAGRLGIFPKSWARWFLDEPESAEELATRMSCGPTRNK